SLWVNFESVDREAGIHVRQVPPELIPPPPRPKGWVAEIHTQMTEQMIGGFNFDDVFPDTEVVEGPDSGTASGGEYALGDWNGQGQLRATRHTIVRGEFGLSLIGYSTEENWDLFQITFDQIVGDVEITPPKGTTEAKQPEDIE
ncbi:MAG: hypothetical protein KY476_25135, partial [Planctomycetes bacterium]|nr:hypothetical protein [Planctomycetota bacterium]